MNIYTCFPEGKTKALTMSYDDGMVQDERLISIFNKYGIKGTFNLNAGLYAENSIRRLPRERIKEIYEGHEVATHSYTHPTIERCPLVQVASEILQDRIELERITGSLVRGHAYPNGSYTDEIKTLFKQLGIAYGRVVKSKPDFALPTDLLEWNPTCHHNDPKLLELGEQLVNYKGWHYLKLMYVWGHSYEFDRDDNWDVIEKFCELVGGHDDIWYATNLEIVDYMEALSRLKFSGNGLAVFNPSAQCVWLMTPGRRIIKIPGGELVSI